MKPLILTFLIFISVSISSAEELHGIKFNSDYSSHGKQMELKGMSFKRVFFIRVFTAGFYLDTAVASQDALQDVPKRVEATFLVHIPGNKLSKYTESMIQKNMTEEEYRLLGERIKVMEEYLFNLNSGDRYAITYIPGVGTKFEYNDKLVGIIQGEDFARGIFSVWVGEHPIDRNVRKQLLGSQLKD